MTHDTTAGAATTPDGKPTFTIVPTLDGYVDLAQRVEHLEANVPATVPDTDVPDSGEIDQLHDRLDRHRGEIDEIKRRYNSLVRWLNTNVTNTGDVPTSTSTEP